MSNFYDFDETAATTEGGSGGSKILETGVYDVTLVTVSETVASTGTTGMDWNIMVPGSKYGNMVYGMWTVKSDGNPIAFNMQKVQALMGLVGAKKLTTFQKSIEVQGGTKMVTAYKEFDGVKVQVAVQKILDVYNGEVREKNEIAAFFGTDGKTYAEHAKGSPAKQKEYYTTKFQDKQTEAYKKFMADGGGDTPEPGDDTSDGSSLL